jgi:beta-glucanase (GH16 family)
MRVMIKALMLAIAILLPSALAAATGDPLDRSRLVATFTEEFDRPVDLRRWKTQYWFGNQRDAHSRYLRGKINGDERQIYSDPAYNGIDPFRHYSDSLAITARTLAGTTARDPRNSAREFSAGLITSQNSYSQLYGYFEMRARLPKEPGLVPAFWLLAKPDWSIRKAQIINEIDVVEVVTDEPARIYMTTHRSVGGKHVADEASTVLAGGTGFTRTYGVLWSAEWIVWYVDDREVRRIRNLGFHRPMYMLANLAVGGWAKPTLARDARPVMLIDHIRAYRVIG